ncbi:hypothetical protein [Pseudoduganella sp. OTU4001]|uniref:hypothetical protein n=1 Tax=Pseudoduganella sp. OTU4001 TaxID=3043854 RepID=UPI00313E6B43
MKIAKHMEAIFVATLLIIGGINMATAKAMPRAQPLSPADAVAEAASEIPELPFVLVAANL